MKDYKVNTLHPPSYPLDLTTTVNFLPMCTFLSLNFISMNVY
jgi:hypothetical protein